MPQVRRQRASLTTRSQRPSWGVSPVWMGGSEQAVLYPDERPLEAALRKM